MATQGRRTDSPLEAVLFEEGHRFEFFQAVRLLERLYPTRRPVGVDARPSAEVARFRAALSLDFAPSEIAAVERTEGDAGRVEVTVGFMGLTGPVGVLPKHYTQLLLTRVRAKDRSLRDFLDLFNHRLLSLFYRAWEKYRFPVAYERAVWREKGNDRFSAHLFDLIGMGTSGLRGRLPIADRVLLFYVGLLAQQPRSASALQGLLADYFGVPVEIVQFVGEWLPLAEENRSRLGGDEANNVLGVSAIAGARVWDPQAKFRLRLGPLGFARFSDFLPAGSAYPALVALTRFVAGQQPSFDVQPVLAAAEVPACRVGGAEEGAPRLGWSSWLASKAFVRDAEDAVFVEGRGTA